MISLPPEVKNLSISVCLGVKSLRAKWIILQLLLQKTHIIRGLSSAHYIHKSPNLLHTAVEKIITISTHSATPSTPLPFFLQIPSAPSFPPRYPLRHPWDTIHMYKYTVSHTHRHTHTHLYIWKRYTQTWTHTRTHSPLVCVWGYQFDTGHCDYVFSVLQSGGRDKGPVDYSKAKHHSSYRGRERWSGGCEGDSGWRPVSQPFVFHHFKKPAFQPVLVTISEREWKAINNITLCFSSSQRSWAKFELGPLRAHAAPLSHQNGWNMWFWLWN